jgi:CubicO group peptidase (beta-lactamase class C family)
LRSTLEIVAGPEGAPGGALRARLAAILENAISLGVIPGAVLWAGPLLEGKYPGQPLCVGSLGRTRERAPVTWDAMYDLASVTKLASTTLLFLLALSAGKAPSHLDPDARLKAVLPDVPADLRNVTIRQLLCHQSGLPAWAPIYLGPPFPNRRERVEAAKALVLRQRPLFRPGASTLYSDLGFMLLGFILESALGVEGVMSPSLQFLFGILADIPLELKACRFSPRLHPEEKNSSLPPIAPTEDGLRVGGPLDSREAKIMGPVPLGACHDDNAAYLFGIAGHAGLFASVLDLHKILKTFAMDLQGPNLRIKQELLQEFLIPQQAKDGSLRPMGFDRLPLPKGTLVGHLGYTGATLWWSPVLDRGFILLTNRVHPSSREARMPELRKALIEEVFPELI